ncbi:MAG: chromate transporter [Clostridia bacterium]|nr:chromate transporter [Clostridia bacterium]
MKKLLKLFFLFAKIGITTFGGGYAMLPILKREIVEKQKLATEEELMDYYAVGQCTPGIISVNTATFIGYKTAGIIGAIVATLGIVTPSFFVILLIASFLNNFSEIPMVQQAFRGINVCVSALILTAVLSLWKKNIPHRYALLLFLLAFLLNYFLKLSPIWVILLVGILGMFQKSEVPKQ